MTMRKLFVILSCSLLLGGCNLKNLFIKKPAGLEITTSAPATVFLGDQDLGKTPLKNENIAPGTYNLRLLPDDTTLSPYESSVTLESAASTVIVRNFGETVLDSYGYSLSLVPDQADLATLSVVSDPDTSSLTLDGVPTGFTPLSKRELTPGSHEVVVGTPGYAEQKISVVTALGYNLIVNTKLKAEPLTLTPPPVASTAAALTSSPAPSTTPAPTSLSSPPPSPLAKPYVTVSDSPDVTAAGGLNVRKEPSSSADSLGKADVGEHLKYLGETTSAGWHKIEFEGSVGYVSAKYATLTK